jgi:hypothetical protein
MITYFYVRKIGTPQPSESSVFGRLLDAKVEWKILIIIRIALGAE